MFISTVSIISRFKLEYLSVHYIRESFRNLFLCTNLDNKSKLLVGSFPKEKISLENLENVNLDNNEITTMNKGKGKEIKSIEYEGSSYNRKYLRRTKGSSSLFSEYKLGESSNKEVCIINIKILCLLLILKEVLFKI